MSSGIATPPSLPPEAPLVAPPTEYEGFIDQRLRQTRRQVKNVDIASGLATLAIGVLVYLLAAALADHWLIVGGLGFFGRWLLWLGLVGAAGTYFAFSMLTPLLHRVNPIFAASTIEKSQPSLRNSLINFLLFRGRRRELAAPVYQALEQRAAADLSKVHVETAVDRTHLIRLCCALAAVLALFSLYLFFSPKDPLRSAARVLLPWSNVEAPTRVTIRDVHPGDTPAFHGEFITVSAELAGLRDGEKPMLIYTTADGQSVDQAIPMTLPEGSYRYQCRLPPGKLGLQQDYHYHLAAGDCRTRVYRITVQSAPAIVVDKVVYRYPRYTGLADQTLQRKGDLRAIEGTEAEIHATANTEIKPGTAEIDLGCTGRRGLRMTAEGSKAIGRFTLRMDPDDAAAPQYESYQLRFSNLQGRENTRPVRHRIEVVRDLPPEIQLLEPQRREVQVAENGKLTIRLRAEDPDFALRRVALRAVRDGRDLSIAPLLEKRRPEKPLQGEFQGEYLFEPARLGLKAGDRVHYWGQAEDNKEPTANRSVTEKQWIVIAGTETRDGEQKQPDEGKRPARPEEQKPSNDRSDQGRNADRQPQDRPPDDPAEKQQPQDESQTPNGDRADRQPQESSDDKQGGEQSDGGQQGDAQSAQPADQADQRVDPEAEPGDAMQEILNDRQRQQKDRQSQDKSQTENQQSGKQQNDQQKSDNQRRDDQRQQADNQAAGTERSSSEKQEEGISGAGKTGNEPSDDQKSGGEQSAGTESPRERGGSEKGDGKKSTASEDAGGKSGSENEKSDTERSDGNKGVEEQSDSRRKDGEARGQEESGKETAEGKRTGSAAGEKRPQPTTDEQSTAEKKPPVQKPGQRELPVGGEKSDKQAGGPLPQEEAQPRDKQRPDKAGQAPGERKEDDAQSPGIGKKESDSQGDTAGDRKGGGKEGGGQQSDQPGVGGPGSHTPADEGGSQTDEQGEGDVGDRAGDQAASKSPTGAEQKAPTDGRAADGAEQKAATDGRAPDGAEQKAATDGRAPDGQKQGGSDDSAERGKPQENPDEVDSPVQGTAEGPKARGSGAPTGGGKPGKSDPAKSPQPTDSPADRANLEYARRQTALALEHLRDQLAKEKPELLERLGWSKDEARRFLERWEEMQRAAARKGAAGEKAKRKFNDALKSLGLRPRGTELRRGGVASDKSETLRDAGRFAPPPEWADQFRAYTRGIAGEERRDDKNR